MAPKAENLSAGTDGEWESLVEPYAPTFPFENDGDVLVGEYLSVKQVEQDDLQNPGQKRLVNCYEILSGTDGTKYSAWGTYSIDEGMAKASLGDTVRIVFHGKVDIKGGAQTVNQFTVQRKSAV